MELKRPSGKVAQNVYLIGEEGSRYVKIGISKDPSCRVYDSAMNPRRIFLIDWFPAEKYQEKVLHKACKKWHVRGEWFVDCVPVRRQWANEKRISLESGLWSEAQINGPEKPFEMFVARKR